MDDSEFAEALETVLRDLRAQTTLQPHTSEAEDYGTILHSADGTGQGLHRRTTAPAPDRLANLADQVQEWAVEALWSIGAPAVWPHCPTHPNSHPLTATVVAEAMAEAESAVWACPKSGAVVARVGELESSEVTGTG